MANFPVASLTDLPQDHLPVAVQLVLADSVNQALTPDQWLLLFRNADAFGAPINPYRIPPDAAGLWRVDNPRTFDYNDWIVGSENVNFTGDFVEVNNQVGQLYFHARLAEGIFFDLHDGNFVMDAEFDGPMFRLMRLTVRNHQPFLQLERTITFAHYWFEMA
ncbi:unnamed protein product [Brassica oleracea var. botrytis]|uniref:Uncharacterized protein n=2 Tax=Brassica oleracea var. oleracea TaxID=109376 RepID=A0A0D2ZTM5_BRAOL|nr:PREDICTED: uncharacterized protein LOC106320879 [Brassica oleracea var. oleracea]